MTPSELRAAGRLLFGERWQTPLARALGVNPRTVRGWFSSRRPPPDPERIKAEVRRLVEDRAAESVEWLFPPAPNRRRTGP